MRNSYTCPTETIFYFVCREQKYRRDFGHFYGASKVLMKVFFSLQVG